MKKQAATSRTRNTNIAIAAANQRAELYYMVYPRTPSAVRRPKLLRRAGAWIALLGPSLREGIAGFGVSVEEALRAFDLQYLNALRPPAERIEPSQEIAMQRNRPA
jgi:hypothetical protein